MSADVRTQALELLSRLRLHGASMVVQMEPTDCRAAAGVLEALLTEFDQVELAAGKNRDSCIRLEKELEAAKLSADVLQHALDKVTAP